MTSKEAKSLPEATQLCMGAKSLTQICSAYSLVYQICLT